MNVERQELVFIRKNVQKAGHNRVAWSADAFTSFNGQPINDGQTQSEFEAEFKFLGVASSNLDFTGDIPNRAGFAAIIAGSITINNTSNDTIYPADLVRWHAPSIEAAKRGEQYKSVSYALRGHFSTQQKYVATLSRVTFDDLVEKWHHTAATLWDSVGSLKIPQVRASIARGKTPSMPDDHASALWLKQFISLISYQTLVAAVQTEYVTPNDMFVTDAAGLATYDRLRGEVCKNWQNRRLNANPARADVDAHKTKVERFATVAAHIFGLTSDLKRSVTEDIPFQRRIIARATYSHLSHMDSMGEFANWITDEFKDPPRFLNDAYDKPNPATPNPALQLQRIKGDALSLVYRSIAKDVYSFVNTIVGVASNTALPNGPIHIVLS